MQKIFKNSVVFALIALSSACGGHATIGDGEQDSTLDNDSQSTIDADDDAESAAATGDTDEGQAAGLGTQPTFLETMRGIGHTGIDTVTVRTKTRLKVKFTPGVQDTKVVGTGYSPTYSKLGLYVAIGSLVRSSTMLANGIASEVQSSAIMDFSSVIEEFPCAMDTYSYSDEGCERVVTIQVERPSYDFLCFNYGSYCPHNTVDKVHPWNGTLEIETDDTYEIESGS